jgi:hypothetical protein
VNSFEKVDPSLIDVFPSEHDGYPDHLAAEDTIDNLRECCGAATRDFPNSLWIEPKHWKEFGREVDANKTWAMNFIDRFTNQNPTHECTTHSLRANFEAARNRQLGIIYPNGPKKNFRYDESKRGSVWVSPLSVYSEANPRIRGGANVRQVMEIACRRGMLPEKIQPFEYGFKHTLVGTQGAGGLNQSHGDWVALKDFPDGWQETAANFKPLEVIFPESWEQAICLVLHGIAVSVGRNGHAVPWAQYNFEDEVMAYPDSYDVIRYDSLRTVKSAYQGSFGIVTVTSPDDWKKPAGDTSPQSVAA